MAHKTKLAYAHEYLNAGLSITPTDQHKKPTAGSWSNWQTAAMSAEDAKKHIREEFGIALIAGKVSGGLECIDVDCKYDLSGKLWQSFSDALKALPNDLYSRLCVAQTQNKGYHVIYRCETVGRNLKLANRPSTNEELAKKNAEIEAWNVANSDQKPKQLLTLATIAPKTIVETRGEGGYFLVYPSTGYQFIQRDAVSLAQITPEEREMILACARLHDECAPAQAAPIATAYTPPKAPVQPKHTTVAEISPWEDYNDQHDVLDFIQPYWEQGTGTDAQGRSMTRICNSSDGQSNGVYYQYNNTVILFSPNYSCAWVGYPVNTPLAPFNIYAGAEHNGDKKAATRALAQMGYGTPKTQTKAQPAPKPPKREPQATAISDGGGLENNPYFRLLGFDKTESGVQAFFFFRKESNTLLRLTAASMSKNNLMTLAPLGWWEEAFEKQTRNKGLDVDSATNWLIQVGQKKGHFRTNRVRGRGAWTEDKRVVIHTGDKLIVDGQETALDAYTSKFVYESGDELGIGTKDPLPTTEARKLLEICNSLSWARKQNGTLLAGWCVVAPVCGALPWRPHVWLTGEAGTGKSTAFREILKPTLGKAAIIVQGNTSESGIRQTLQFDAIPIVFDEAEAEDKASQDRMASILTLMRAASSEGGGNIIKGGQDGQAKAYSIRSCFAYASIVFQATQQADRRRITVLETRKLHNKEEATAMVKKFSGLVRNTLTEAYVSRLQARTVKLLPTILANSKTFATAVIEVVGQQWAGDQLGIILAGAYSLQHDGEISLEDAITFVQKHDWNEETAVQEQSDQMRLLAKIVEQPIRLEQGRERSVGELILLAAQDIKDPMIEPEYANSALKRLGIKVELTALADLSEVYISNTADWLKKTLRDTPWGSNHNKVLERIEGAKKVSTPVRFAGVQARAVSLPIALFKD